ncbi:MAG: c-type cytochrome [Acidobacteriota bacterium]
MRTHLKALGLLAISFAVALPQQVVPGDAAQGEKLFARLTCTSCHRLYGSGGQRAPELGTRVAHEYTPARMSSLVWNHVPLLAPGREMDTQEAADLFAYFASARYFERSGNARRGKRIFQSRRCGECHAISPAGQGRARPVAAWQSLGDPIAAAQQMWNRSPQMRQLSKETNIHWHKLTSQEVADLLVYFRNLRQTRPATMQFCPGPPETGRTLFQTKGCGNCHQGRLSLQGRSERTLTDFAAAMWNHALRLGDTRPALEIQEMRALVGYLWSAGFFDERGDQRRGRHVFVKNNCASCHNGATTGAPSLTALASQGGLSSIPATAAVWTHGPAMFAGLKRKNLAWPRFNGSELADLAAYLSAKQAQ